jgi:hypothetical protein
MLVGCLERLERLDCFHGSIGIVERLPLGSDVAEGLLLLVAKARVRLAW